jgi:hypothetical protein
VILRENFKKEILLDIIRLAILPEPAAPEHESVKILTLPFFS